MGKGHGDKRGKAGLLPCICQYGYYLFAEPFAYNTASCRVLEKAGFQLEGLLRSNAVKNGQVQDMKMYALVRETE